MSETERRFAPAAAGLPTIRVAGDGGAGQRLSGYGAVFYDGTAGTEFKLAPGVVERIVPTAFDRALADGHDVRGLFNHSADMVLGRVPKTLKLSVDARGLRYVIKMPNTTLGRDVLESVKRGDVTGSSFAFFPLDDRWSEGPGDTLVREILDLELVDISVVTFPAYRAADATAGERKQRSRMADVPLDVYHAHIKMRTQLVQIDASL